MATSPSPMMTIRLPASEGFSSRAVLSQSSAWKTPSSSVPGKSRVLGFHSPVPTNTASYRASRLSMSWVVSGVSQKKVMSRSSSRERSKSTISCGSRKGGIPSESMPPGNSAASMMSMWQPSRARVTAQASEVGPAPMQATFFPVGAAAVRMRMSSRFSSSVMNRWSLAILTGSSSRARMQAPSHSSLAGQMREQLAPSGLFSRMVSAAPLMFPRRRERMNRAGSVPAGHARLHGASWQSRQRDASAMAARASKPFSSSRFSMTRMVRLILFPSFSGWQYRQYKGKCRARDIPRRQPTEK